MFKKILLPPNAILTQIEREKERRAEGEREWLRASFRPSGSARPPIEISPELGLVPGQYPRTEATPRNGPRTNRAQVATEKIRLEDTRKRERESYGFCAVDSEGEGELAD